MTVPEIDGPGPDRRDTSERRLLMDRRSGVDRRERHGERRAPFDRRMALQSAGDQIRGALKVMTNVIESGTFPEAHRRTLDTAMLRLRVALERLDDE